MVAGAGGVESPGAGGAVVAGAGGVVVAGAGGGERPGAGGAVVAGAGGGDSPGAGGADRPGAGAVVAGAFREGATVLLGATGATPTGTGAGIVTICPAAGAVAGCSGAAGVASAVRVGPAVAPGEPCRATDVSVTPGVGGGRSVGSLGPDAVDWPSSGPRIVGSAGCRAHAAAAVAITAATSAARRAVSVMQCDTASRVPARCGVARRDGAPAHGAMPRCHRASLRVLRVRTGPALVRRSQRAVACPRAPSTRRP